MENKSFKHSLILREELIDLSPKLIRKVILESGDNFAYAKTVRGDEPDFYSICVSEETLAEIKEELKHQ